MLEYRLIILVSLIWFMVQFSRYVFPPLFETLQGTYSVSNTQTGLLFTLLMLGYSAAQLPAGMLGDRFGEPIIILSGVGIFAIASIIIFFAPSFTLFTAAAVLIGIGTGIHKTVAIPFLSKQYPHRTGSALGILDTIGQFGGIVAPIIVVGLLSSSFHWSLVFPLIAIAGICLGILFIQNIPSSTLSPNQATVEGDGDDYRLSLYLSIFSDTKLTVFLVVMTLFTFSWNGIASFLPLFFANQKGLSPTTASTAYSLLFVASLSQLITGNLSDRIGRLPISILLFCVMILSLVLIIIIEMTIPLLLLTLIMGIGLHGFRPVRDSYLMDLIPTSIGGGVLGIVRTIMTLVGALSPVLVGYLTDISNFVVSFSVLIASLSLGGLLVAFLKHLSTSQ
nr:MFS transporter [Halalkalicoccus sp. NIPERK01]